MRLPSSNVSLYKYFSVNVAVAANVLSYMLVIVKVTLLVSPAFKPTTDITPFAILLLSK